MNILIIPAFFYTKDKPTLGSFFMEQAIALKQAGHNVVILYCDTYSVKCIKDWVDYKEENVEVLEGIKVYRKKVFCPLKHGIEGHKKAFSKAIQELYSNNIAGKMNIDIIHAHCCVWAGYAAMKLSEKEKKPYVITEHATLFKLHANKISSSNNKCIEETFRKAAKVICVSGEFRKLIARYRNEEDIEVIGNVVDCELFKPNDKIQTPYSTGECIFLTVCHMQTKDQLYKKGIDILLKAWKELVKIHPEAKLIIGGGGHSQSKVVEWCKEYNILDSVEMAGSLERTQVAEYMSKCDFFVLPSRYETFGVVYIEAMASGKPVIAAKNGGPDDFIKDFNGILIEPEDVEGLISAMCSMMENPSKYNPQMISEYVNKNFSRQAVACQLEKVYTNIKKGKTNVGNSSIYNNTML
jgi:glycosyltransferase involved in cell wall biosynthesis